MQTKKNRLWLGIVSVLPEMFDAISRYGITGKAISRGLAELHFWNPRDFAEGERRNIDHKPFGGGPGMLMMAAPLRAALAKAKKSAPTGTKTIYLTPQGRRLNQQAIFELSQASGLILLAGRYEGIDERVIELDIDEEWSVGDYILTGGELPAMLLMDSIIRLLPGAVGNEASVIEETFSTGLLDHPHFTKPQYVGNLGVPEVLLSGNHQAIRQWRLKQSLGRTMERRPDILQKRKLSETERELLQEYFWDK